jgi:uncharacterized protein (DUF2252 family)
MQASTTAALGPVARRRKSYVVRELQPREDRLDLAPGTHGLGALEQLIRDMGRVVAWAHLRASGRQGAADADSLMEFCRSRGWKGSLRRIARVAASDTLRHWKRYRKAYDKGAFDCTTPGSFWSGTPS